MEKEFKLELTAQEREYLLGVARLAVVKGLSGRFSEEELPSPPSEVLNAELGAFVTLKKNGSLRGCIGRIVGDGPLFLTVARMAQAAAFNDHRFERVSLAEEDSLEYEISVLGPIEPCLEPEKIVIGKHGLIMRKGGRQGLLLPQVPLEWGWDRETFLRKTCGKAGLPADEWQNAWATGGPKGSIDAPYDGSGTELYWFESAIFGED